MVHDSSRASQSALIKAERVEDGSAKGEVGGGVGYGGMKVWRVGVRKGRASGLKIGRADRYQPKLFQSQSTTPPTVIFKLLYCPPCPI
jgi:hypothetical protein